MPELLVSPHIKEHYDRARFSDRIFAEAFREACLRFYGKRKSGEISFTVLGEGAAYSAVIEIKMSERTIYLSEFETEIDPF